MKKYALLLAIFFIYENASAQYNGTDKYYYDISGSTHTIPEVGYANSPIGSSNVNFVLFAKDNTFENLVTNDIDMVNVPSNMNAGGTEHNKTWTTSWLGYGPTTSNGITLDASLAPIILSGQKKVYDLDVAWWKAPYNGAAYWAKAFKIEVHNTSLVNPPTMACWNDIATSYDLRDYISFKSDWTKVSFTGTGVISNRYFSPSTAGEGTHQISVEIAFDNGIKTFSFSIEVVEPDVNIGSNIEACWKDPRIELSNASNITWTGVGIENDANKYYFNPQAPGEFTLRKYVTENGCTKNETKTAKVNYLPYPAIKANGTQVTGGTTGNEYTFCKESSVSLLATGGVSYSWSPSTGLSNSNIANPVVSGLTQETEYTLTVENGSGCTNDIKLVLKPIENTTAAVGASSVETCPGQAVGLSASGGTSYSWSPSTGLSDPNIASPTATVTSDKTYTVTVTDENGCTKSLDVDVNVLAVPSINLRVNGSVVSDGENKNICSGESATLEATVTNAVSYSWLPATGLSDASIRNPTASPSATTTYTVTVVNDDGCVSSKSVKLSVLSLPTVSAGDNKSVCIAEGTLALAGATPAGGSWSTTSNGLSGSTLNLATAGIGSHTMTYTYTNANGCTNSDQMTVTVLSNPNANAGPNTSYCIDNGLVTLGSTGAWSSPNGVTKSGSTYYFDPSIGSGNYALTYTVTNSNGCSDSDTKIITVNGLPNTEAGNNVSLCIDDGNYALSGFSPAGGSWTGTGLVGPSLFDPSLAGVGTYTLTYTYTNANGCTAADDIIVTVSQPTVVDIGSSQSFCEGSGVYNLSSDLAESDKGGVWSGTGVSGNNFIPTGLSQGNYTITYTFTNANGCVSTQSKEFNIIASPDVDAGTNIEACSNESAFDILDGTPIGGSWSGVGITDSETGTFDPQAAGPGNHLVTYEYSDGSCAATDTKYIIVNSPTAVNAGANLTKCEGDIDFILTGASQSGGLWSGTGVSGNYFSPAASGPGTFTVTYTYTSGEGCASSDTRTVTINSQPTVDAGPDLTLCLNGGNYSLIDDVNVEGGSFSGTGVSGLNFDPAVAGVGTHQVTYAYTNTNSCSNSDIRYIAVIAPQTVSVGGGLTVCIDDAPLTISGSESINGGSWSGPGLTGTNFSPVSAGEGFHTLTYTVADGNGCVAIATRDITVKAKPVVEAGQDIFVCAGTPLVSLDGTASPVGGAWSGPHVTGNKFDATASGAGIFEITYSYNDADGCANTDTKEIVVDGGTTVSAGPDISICTNEGLLDLASKVTPGGGTFTGPGIIGNNFDPSVGAGSYTITYALANEYGCTGSDQVVITVHSVPTVNAGTDATLCFNENPLNLAATAIPAGGYFVGPGVSGNHFEPSAAGVGTHQVMYFFTNANGCESVGYRQLEVTALPQVDAGGNDFVCIDADIIDLDAAANVNGGVATWSGPGITNGLFSPSAAGVGTHTVVLNVAFGNGCNSTDTKTIKVFEQLEVDAGSDITACLNSGLLDLNQGASVTNGTWSGTGVSGSNFNTSIGAGNYVVTLSYTNTYGCSDTDTKTITVITPASVSVGSDLTVCTTAPALDLSSSASPSGGAFSGSGVVGNIFTPSAAGIGIHEISYSYTGSDGCSTTKKRLITVTAPPAIDAGQNIVTCFSNEIIDLDEKTVTKGGSWSGSAGVNGGFFSGIEAGLGIHTLTYTIDHGDGCISQDNITVNVREDITVDAGANVTLCENEMAIDLSSGVNKSGGSWSGSQGLVVDQFHPNNAGVGAHQLIYSYTNSYGCSATDTKTITVLDATQVNAGGDKTVCTTAGPINLNASVYPSGGSWSGSIGVSGTLFDPSKVSPGDYELTYALTNENGCTTEGNITVTVTSPAPVDAGENFTVCLNSGLVNLDNLPEKQGGLWSGAAVSNNLFDPAYAGVGNYVLTYTYDDGNGCITSDNLTVVVREQEIVDAGADIEVCINANNIDLAFEPNYPGGAWHGTGISSNSFSPSTAGVGAHNITYTYTDQYGCASSDVKRITVRNTDKVNAGPQINVCTTSGPIMLDGSVFPTGGSWSGPAVNGNTIDPGLLDVGTYSVTYTYTNEFGCSSVDEKSIVVEEPLTMNVGDDLTMCLGSGTIALNNDVAQKGGNWSGNGVISDYFYPSVAGIGIHTLTYTYTYGGGCISVSEKVVEVIADPTVALSEDLGICINNNAIDLTTYASPSSGSWSGSGVTNNLFDPKITGVGAHEVTYTYTNENGCSTKGNITITVNDVPSVDAGPAETTICTTAGLVDLSTGVSPAGGVWSGPGIDAAANTFDPELVGAGEFNLVYTFTEATGCSNSDTRLMVVENPATIDAGENLVVCVDSEKRDLDLDVSITGGEWSGSAALDGSFFDPAAAGVGNYVLIYTYDNGFGCIATDSRSVQVREAVTVDAGADLAFCINDLAYDLTGQASKSGGSWSGNGVIDGKFDPAVAGQGTHELSYTYQDPFGCSATGTKNITVNGIPSVDAGTASTTVCTTAGLVDLATGVSPVGGVWSGPGIDAAANTFDPELVGAGEFNLVYTFTEATGCSNSDTRLMVVENPATIDAGENLVVCVDSEKRDLDLDVSITGGEWSGSAALDGSFFDPAAAGVGNYVLIYTYDNGFGCIATDSRSVQVREAVTVDAGADLAFCINDLAFDLTGQASKSGGSWSGNGVIEGKFDPVVAGQGTHELSYTYQDAYGCSAIDTKTISVNTVPVVDAGTAETTVCTTNGLVDLTSGVSPEGGSWSGPGIDTDANTFDPGLVGKGSYDLIYTYTNDNGCSGSDVKTYVVNAPPTVEAGENFIVCIDSKAIDLDLDVSITGGDWSGSPALDGSYFAPALAGIGTHVLTYTYDNGLGCISTDVISVQVKSEIVVNAGENFTMCVNENPVELSDVDKQGGIWSGLGIDGEYFDPALAGIGSHTLTYTYYNAYGCVATDTRTATVIGLPDVSAGSDIAMCITDGERNLTNDVYPLGGVFKGPSIIGNTFNPTAAGAGAHTITYTYTNENGCAASDTKTITVNNLPVVDAGNDFEVCINAAPITLSAISEGGSWSGTGIISGVFDPLSAGLGEHKLVYSLVNGQNCLNTDTIMVRVLEEPELIIGGQIEICVTSTPINVAADVNMNGGAFSGNGIVGNLFNPQEAGVGIHIISYTVRYNGCDLTEFREVIVNEAATVDIGPDLTLCTDSEAVNLILGLSESVSGKFEGPGVSNNLFYADSSGLGSHIITFTYENAFGCVTQDQRIISVQDQIPVFAGEDINLCNNITAYELTGLPSPSGGLFVGPGIANNIFDATSVGPGEYVIEYVYEFTNNCVSTDQLVITVKENNVEGIAEDMILCINDTPIDLTQDGQLPGKWIGTGVVNNKFYPALAAVGEFDLIYTDESQDCDIAGIRKANVVSLPKAPSAEQISFTGCSGEFIDLVAKVNAEDLNTNITLAWFEDLDAQQHYALGEKIVHQIKEVDETIYFRGMNSFGCYSNESGYMEIFTENPAGGIGASDTVINFGYSVQLYAQNTKNVKSYKWDFGDGLMSNNKNPYHYYYESDTFDITLELTSANGCTSIISRPKMIRVLPEPGRSEDVVLSDVPEQINGYAIENKVLRSFPNPIALNGLLVIELISDNSGVYKVEAINNEGKTILLKDGLQLGLGYNKVTVPMKKLAIGYHIIEVSNEENKYQVKVVIK